MSLLTWLRRKKIKQELMLQLDEVLRLAAEEHQNKEFFKKIEEYRNDI